MLISSVAIPTPAGNLSLDLFASRSTVFLGANGGGKTRLGVHLDTVLGKLSHRVGAQRALQFKAAVQLIDFDSATEKLHFGVSRSVHPHLKGDMLFGQKDHNRYGGSPATHLLNDYEALLQALFAEENRESVKYRQAMKQGLALEVPKTRFDRLQELWGDLLPHRKLVVLDASIKVELPGGADERYEAMEMSDGERVIFYLIGQCLMLRADSVLIVDEPELHIHRGLISKLWDSLESARPDCAFVYITHDLEFAASRLGADKYALNGYRSSPNPIWDIVSLPGEVAGIPEEVICRILGSRQPILFVEGDSGSEDVALYRRIYTSHTVIPIGGCEAVIRSVASFRANAALHRVECFGLIDADSRNDAELRDLRAANIYVTTVSEIENVYLLPDVFSALAQTFGHPIEEANVLAERLGERIVGVALRDLQSFALRYSKRRIDRLISTLGLESKDGVSLPIEFAEKISAIDPAEIFNVAVRDLQERLNNKDVRRVLVVYDNKGLLAEASSLLDMKVKGLREHIGRMLMADQGKNFISAVTANLPVLSACPKPN